MQFKSCYSILFFAFFISIGSLWAQPPGDSQISDPKYGGDGDPAPSTTRTNCYTVSTTWPLAINLDCPFGNVRTSIYKKTICQDNCSDPMFRVVITASGKLYPVHEVYSSTTKKFVNPVIEVSKFNLGTLNLEKSGTIEFTIRYYLICSDDSEILISEERNVSHLYRNGELYPVLKFKHTVSSEYCPPPGSGEETVCCDQPHKLTYSVTSATTTTDYYSDMVNVVFTAGISSGPATFEVTLPLPLGSPTTYLQKELIDSKSFGISTTISAPGTGCNYPGLSINRDEFELWWVRSNCFGDEIYEKGPEQVFLNPKFYIGICKKNHSENCKPPKTNVRKISNNIRINCVGSFVLESFGDPDTKVNSIYWTGPDGNIVYGNEISGPYGQYKLTIENECCQKFEEFYNLCDQTKTTPWVLQNDGKWCRTVECICDDPVFRNLSSNTYTECVTPDRIEDKFDQNLKKCIKEYYYQDQLLGTTSVDANRETEWDNVFENCVTTYFCNGSEVFEEEYEPETSEWIYDDFWGECRLNVNCMGEAIENVQQSETVIEWEWDDFWEECVSTFIACDGTEVDGEASVIPYEIGEWTYDSQYGCVREILCVDGGDVFRQEISPTYAPEGGQGQCDEGLFEWKVICDGEETDFICLANLSPPTLESRFVKSEKVFIKSMNSELQITLKNTSKDITIMIYDVLGRVSHEKPVNNEYSTIDISLIGVKSGIYVVTVLDAGSVIHSEKIFIQN